MIQRLSVYAGLVVAMAAPAHADVTSDFKDGTSIYLLPTVAHAGPLVTTGQATRISKAAGSLSFTVDAAAVGIDLPIQIHLVGRDAGTGRLVLVFDDRYTDVTIGGDEHMQLTRVEGQLEVLLSALAGADAPSCGGRDCGASISFTVLSGSATVYGSWGTTTVTIDKAVGIAGVRRPRLTAFSPPPPIRNSQHTYELPFCSSSTETVAPLGVSFDAPMPAGGGRVDVKSPRDGVRSPGTVGLGANVQSAVLDARVPARFGGTIELTAGAGGALQTRSFAVRPESECAPPASSPAYEPYAPASRVGCEACSTFVDLTGQVDQLTSVDGRLHVIRDGASTALSALFPRATSIDAAAMNDLGWVAGRITIDDVSQAYRGDAVHGTFDLLGNFTPLAIDPSAVAFGYRTDGRGLTHAAYSNGHGVLALQVSSSLGVAESRALKVADTGQVIGTFIDNAGATHGFRWVRGQTTTLPLVGDSPAIPVAINHANQIAANGSGAAIIEADGSVTQLGAPLGYASFRITSLNRWGYAVGTAEGRAGKRAFAWLPARGFVALSNYATGLGVVDDALRITDANQIVVHGTAGGVTDLYLLTL